MSETVTMTLAEFLLARIAEDEAVWRQAEGRGARVLLDRGASQLVTHGDLVARVLAECEAKRRIVEQCRELINSFGDWDAEPGARRMWSDVNRRERSQAHARLDWLALPYADHPDFREEWRP